MRQKSQPNFPLNCVVFRRMHRSIVSTVIMRSRMVHFTPFTMTPLVSNWFNISMQGPSKFLVWGFLLPKYKRNKIMLVRLTLYFASFIMPIQGVKLNSLFSKHWAASIFHCNVRVWSSISPWLLYHWYASPDVTSPISSAGMGFDESLIWFSMK